MAQSSDDRATVPDSVNTASGEGAFHNSVLMRSSKPIGANHSWAVPAVLGMAAVAGAILWGVMASHPSGPVVNHAVADAPTSFQPTGPG
jgi:hypothetical protein